MPLVPDNLYQVVWQEEIEDLEKLLRDCFINTANAHLRLSYQQAPPELIERFFDLRSKLEENLNDIRDLRRCFHPRPSS